MRIIKYCDIENAQDFLKLLFSENLSERNTILHNPFMDKLTIHKAMVDRYNNIISTLDIITSSLVKNSNLNIDDKVINLFSTAALSVCILEEGKFLKELSIRKDKYELEIKSILEELKMSGIGNGLVKTLSEIFKSILNMSKILFKSKSIYDALNERNLLKTIILYIKKHKLSITDFNNNFDGLFNTIHNLYIKTGELSKFKDKLYKTAQDLEFKNVFTINEFNL